MSFVKDHSGKKSMMRLMSVLALLMACALSLIQAFQFGAGSPDTRMTGMFLLAAFCPKVLQSVAERWGMMKEEDNAK